jgi:outer membrane cobalamin receptor
LRAESSLGWDCGIEQKWGKKHRAQMVYFLNHISDRIDSFARPRPRNLDQDARAEGVEIALQGRFFADDWQYRLAYTRLLQSLSNQPEHALNASVDWQAKEKWLCGAGLQSLSAHSWGGTPLDGYMVARLHGSYQYRPDLRLHVRWENVADESYLLSNFYGTPIAGAGSGVFAGITWDW